MSVDELIENFQDENGYGKFIVLKIEKKALCQDKDTQIDAARLQTVSCH